MDAEQELIEAGLNPGNWQESLAIIKSVLSTADWEKFSRLHRNFVGYRSEATLAKFYGFAFSNDLHLEINRTRFNRLAGILKALAKEIQPGQAILDIGAGCGVIGSLVKRHFAPSAYVVEDSCREVRTFLDRQGFTLLAHPLPSEIALPFDVILCIDSLGEVNSDEDGMLLETSPLNDQEYARLLEERYGLTQKLTQWIPFLAETGRVLFWEPFKHGRAWQALMGSLTDAGWGVKACEDGNGQRYLSLVRT